MATQNRATFFFTSSRGYGWSETFFNQEDDKDIVMAKAKVLAGVRKQLLGTDSFLRYVRVSDDLIKRDSIVEAFPAANDHSDYSAAGYSDIANTALVIRLNATPITRRTLYLRGFDDTIVKFAGEYDPYPFFTLQLKALFLQLSADLWAVKSRTGNAPGVLIGGVAQDPTTGIVTITTLGAHGIGAGQPYQVSGAKGATAINGIWTSVGAVTATTVTLKTTVFLRPWIGGGRVSPLQYALKKIISGQVIRVSHRVTGRPFDSPRGRR